MNRHSYLASHGPALLARGYALVPIRHGLKHPNVRDWTSHAIGARLDADRLGRGLPSSVDQLAIWAADPAYSGVGVLCATVLAVDIDVSDPEAAADLAARIEQRLGRSIRRIGRAPRVLLLYRTDTPLNATISTRYTDYLGDTHGVDFLGGGRQFVAYGWHPDTGAPYRYDGPGLAEIDRDALPTITPVDVEWVRAQLAEVAQRYQWQEAPDRQRERADRAPSSAPRDPVEATFAAVAPRFGASVAQLREMLSRIDPDLDGADYDVVVKSVWHEYGGTGDEREAYEVLRDWAATGVKWAASGVGQLNTRWARAKRGPGYGQSPVRLATVQQWITDGVNAPEALAGAPDEAPGVTPDTVPEAPRKKPFFIEPEWVFAEQFEAPDWLVDGLLVRGETSMIFGESGTYKSFVALGLGYAIATGQPWHGRPVRQGAVVYIPAEGRHGMRARAAAWRQHHAFAGRAPLGFTSGAVLLNDPNALRVACVELDAFTREHGPLALIIADTLARNNGADENDNTAMGQVLANAVALATRYGCAVLFVHHSGTTNRDRARGASAIRGGLDSQYRIDKHSAGVVRLVCTKMKDAPEPSDSWLEAVEVRSPTTGATSVVLVPTEAREGAVPGGVTSPAYGLTGLQRLLYDTIAADQPIPPDVLDNTICDAPAGVWHEDRGRRLRQIRDALRRLREREAITVTANGCYQTWDHGTALDGFG